MSLGALFRQVASGATLLALLTSSALVAYVASAAPGAVSPVGTAPSASAAPPVTAPDQPIVLTPKTTGRIAQSALLTIEGTASDDSLRLSIRRAGDKSIVTGGDITVTVDGKNEPVTRQNGGSYEIPVNDLRGDGSHDAARDVEIIVPHDGIKEILTSKLAVAEPASGGSLLGDHKQMAWWILNIVIVLIAATAISRRKG